MPRLALDAPVLDVKGIGPARAAQLESGGVRTVGDLLWHLPQRYQDEREVVKIGSLSSGKPPTATVVGELLAVRSQRLPGRRRTLSRATVADDTGSVAALWFNRPYLERQVEPGARYLVSGPLRSGARGLELVQPSLSRWTGAAPSGPSPVYPRLGALGPAAVGRCVSAALDALGALDQGDLDALDTVPPGLRERHGLPSLGDALRGIHRPDGVADVVSLAERRSPAHLRLAYGELFALQLRLALRHERGRRRVKTHRYTVDDRVRGLARAALPFRLTTAQRRALVAIVDDLVSPRPMARLLQGEVGSGKTVVAALAMLVALANGLQVAFMAPTELLAEQHRRNLERLLGDRFPVGLLTRSSAERVELARRMARGETLLVVGTHALIEADVALPRLGLVVIDEQHRFGVVQRQRLAAKGRRVDLLVMTATPIPRSLALVLFGDLDLSVLDELPVGRLPVTTQLVAETERDQVLAAIREERAAGGQTYVVLPRIEGGQTAGATVEETGRWYLERLPECRGAILTGRTPAPERERLMRRLANGELDLLVATTVIEVGVDVPGASLMVIESAERFGLSQLHQLRGRVGRGARASRCVAVIGDASAESRERLQIFASCHDGFRIAEADLARRGPGELLGVRQAGLELLRVADPLRHADLLEAARADARELVAGLDEAALAELARHASLVAAKLPAVSMQAGPTPTAATL